MPPIFLHMAVARDLAAEFAGSALDRVFAETGTYLLGATSPDIRVLLRWERERTHFFDLNTLGHQDSVAGFFAAYPSLREAARLNEASVAFISGYLSHLVLDETWIQQIYRPYFGQLSALGGRASADVMDRVLQFELERRRREEPEAEDEIRRALRQCSLSLDVGFLDSETLGRWLDITIEQTHSQPEWERFRKQSARQLRELGVHDEQSWSRFLDQLPHLLQHAVDHVSTVQVDAFFEQAKERALRALGEYLAVRT
jgi:hypothetical protein